jgi:FkbM family methyltransferase
MLLDILPLRQKYNLNITGVVHVGAHHGQELAEYEQIPELKHVVFFEPDPDTFKVLKSVVDSKSSKERELIAINKGLGPFSCEMTLYKETENSGQSNSVLKPKLHTIQYPGIVFNDEIKIKIEPLDKFECSPALNFLNVDTQGFDLEVLRGAKKTLKNFDSIMIEVNREELYEGCGLVDEVDDFLNKFGFKRVETYWAGHTWGDAFYLKQK